MSSANAWEPKSALTGEAEDISYLAPFTGAVVSNVLIKLSEVLSVGDFLATGDGVTVETAEINSAIDALEARGGGVLSFPYNSGTYLIDGPLRISNISKFIIHLNGNTIKMADGVAVTADLSNLIISNCTDFAIRDGIFDANRANRTPAEVSAQTIRCLNVQKFYFENVRSNNAVVDGWYFASSTPADVLTHAAFGQLVNCEATNAYRNGLSIIQGRHIRISGGRYTGTNGTAPQAGIDLESNSGDPTNSIYDVVIDGGCQIDGNAGYGVQISDESEPRKVVIETNAITNNAFGAVFLGGSDCTINDNDFEDYDDSIIASVIETSSSANPRDGNIISNNRFRNITASASKACIASDSTGRGRDIFGNVFYEVTCKIIEEQCEGTTYHHNKHYSCDANNLVGLERDNIKAHDNFFDDCAGFSNINVTGDFCEVYKNKHLRQTNRAINFASGALQGSCDDNDITFTSDGTNNGITLNESFQSLQGNIVKNADTIATCYTLAGDAATEAIGYKRRNLCIQDTGNERLAEN